MAVSQHLYLYVSRTLAAGTCVALVLAAPARLRAQPSPSQSQDAPGLAGRWSLNFQLSQFPREIGFGADWMTGAASGQSSTGGGARGRGSSGGGGVNTWMARPESAEDARRLEILTAEVRNPAVRLTIVESSAAVTITDDQDRSRTFHPDGREEVLRLGDVPVVTTAKWEGGRLVVLYKAAEGRELRCTYSIAATANPPQLVMDVEFIERGGHDKVSRIYDRARAIESSPAAGAVASPQGAAAAPQPPAVAKGPDAELKGLVNLGVVVEDLGSQAIACGLKQDTIETTVTKSLTDAGLRVRRNSDEDTYVYVDILTSSLSTGLCVSRYDVSLYSHTTATLSYQHTPALVQVSLLHKGGIAGGAPVPHAEGVLRGVKESVDQFAARIRDAAK
jgi:hypothetical protein